MYNSPIHNSYIFHLLIHQKGLIRILSREFWSQRWVPWDRSCLPVRRKVQTRNPAGRRRIFRVSTDGEGAFNFKRKTCTHYLTITIACVICWCFISWMIMLYMLDNWWYTLRSLPYFQLVIAAQLFWDGHTYVLKSYFESTQVSGIVSDCKLQLFLES